MARASLPPLLLLLPPLAAGSLAGAGASRGGPEGPGAGPWRLEPPEAHGLAGASVRRGAAHVFGSPEVAIRDCFLVVKDGVLIYEEYSSAWVNTTAHLGNSMTKTLGALLMGWAQTRGLLDIDADITATYGVPSPRPYPVTSRQIMSQAIGGTERPGQAWQYDASGGLWLNVLPEVFLKATGRSPSEVWVTEFATPLGLSEQFSWLGADWTWATGSEGLCKDYARIGQLLLNQGHWPGVKQPLVDESYVREMRTPQTRYAPYTDYSNPCYGLLTWLNTNPGSDRGSDRYPGVCQMFPRSTWFPAGSPSDVYSAAGILGQETIIDPSHNLVVVSMGDTSNDYPVERVVYEGVCLMFPGECQGFGDPADATHGTSMPLAI